MKDSFFSISAIENNKEKGIKVWILYQQFNTPKTQAFKTRLIAKTSYE